LPQLGAVHLNGLRAVEAVARGGSLLKAAEELGVSPSAVSQQVSRTEKQIGRPLFERTRDGLAPTEFGALFAARLSAGFHELAQAVAMADDSAAHTLVVSVAPAFASRWLVPRLSRLYAKHPGLALRMDANVRLVDFHRSDIDLAIRMGDGHWPGAHAEPLLALEIFPVCAPAIAKRLKTIPDLANEWAICDENSLFTWDRWFETAGAVHRSAPLPRSSDRRTGDHARLAIARRRRAGGRPPGRAIRDQRPQRPWLLSGHRRRTPAERESSRVQALDRRRSGQNRRGFQIQSGPRSALTI
jgi:DNA-binding transcriptional LysR family regulator